MIAVMFADQMTPGVRNTVPSLPSGQFSLTFDDGPGATEGDGPGPRTLELAQYLADEQVPATFFMCGKHIRLFPRITEEVLALGHQVGNHSHSHLPSASLDAVQLREELKSTYELLRTHGAPERIPFRPPYGDWTPDCATAANADEELANAHSAVVGWDIDGGDWSFWELRRPAAACTSEYLLRMREKGSGIVLMHDSTADDEPRGSQIRSGNRTLEVVKEVVPRLRAEGSAFVRLPID